MRREGAGRSLEAACLWRRGKETPSSRTAGRDTDRQAYAVGAAGPAAAVDGGIIYAGQLWSFFPCLRRWKNGIDHDLECTVSWDPCHTMCCLAMGCFAPSKTEIILHMALHRSLQ